jgi:hypothetical protein
VANALHLETLPLDDVPQATPISDQLESKNSADSKEVQANFGDDIRPAPPALGNPHFPEIESILLDPKPNEQVSPMPTVQKPSMLRETIEICNILWLGLQGLVFGIHEHVVVVAGVLAHAYSVTALTSPGATPYPLLLHPISWVILGLARGASVTGCFAICLVLGLLFLWQLWIAVQIFKLHTAFGPPVSPENVQFALVMLMGAVTLYVEYLGVNCGEKSRSENASFIQSKVCK